MKYVTFDETTVTELNDQDRQEAILEVQAALQLLYREVQRVNAVKALADQKMRETPEYQKLMEEASAEVSVSTDPVVSSNSTDPNPVLASGIFPGRPGMFR